MTPIKRGTARRLGLDKPTVPEPFSFEQFGVAMADLESRLKDALALGIGAPLRRPSAVD